MALVLAVGGPIAAALLIGGIWQAAGAINRIRLNRALQDHHAHVMLSEANRYLARVQAQRGSGNRSTRADTFSALATNGHPLGGSAVAHHSPTKTALSPFGEDCL